MKCSDFSWYAIKDFFEYLTDGLYSELRPDAPDSARKAYEKWLQEEKENNEKGIF